ncbi:FliI/YscN family ATPase [Myxococcota bacterium]|nr:FliI/YscN family ATPase [Myxococcota bacterium]
MQSRPFPASLRDVRALTAALEAGASPAPGSVLAVVGNAVRVAWGGARLGARVRLGGETLAEVVAFDGLEATVMPLGAMRGLTAGAPVTVEASEPALHASEAVLGRVLDGLGTPVDGGPPLPVDRHWPVDRPGPDPLTRRPVDTALPLGVRVIDALCTLGRGQRLALQAGPGAGKTTLLAQVATTSAADVVVLALIGERGREAAELLARLSPSARARTVVVLSRADDPPLLQWRAAETATALAEYFRGEGRDVLLLLDSLTRVARAVRVVGVSRGEPATRRGFPPSLSTALSALIERAGNDAHGTLTALYTVLVEGDDVDDPVAEEARALLDGHLALDAGLAGAGRFPAVAVSRSVSRCMAQVASPTHGEAARRLRRWLAAGEARADLVAIGAYQRGTDADADAWLARRDALEAFLRQRPDELSDFATTVRRLGELTR